LKKIRPLVHSLYLELPKANAPPLDTRNPTPEKEASFRYHGASSGGKGIEPRASGPR